jgi:hypothetical protein
MQRVTVVIGISRQGVCIVKRFCIDGLGINRGQLERLFQEEGL